MSSVPRAGVSTDLSPGVPTPRHHCVSPSPSKIIRSRQDGAGRPQFTNALCDPRGNPTTRSASKFGFITTPQPRETTIATSTGLSFLKDAREVHLAYSDVRPFVGIPLHRPSRLGRFGDSAMVSPYSWWALCGVVVRSKLGEEPNCDSRIESRHLSWS